jgi:hypothetical protein
MSKIKSIGQWVVGVFFCFLALGALVSGGGIIGFLRGLIAAGIFLGVAILAIPTTRQRISRESGITFSTWVVVGLVFVGLMTGMIVSPVSDTDEADNITDETAPDIDEDIANGENETEADDDRDETEVETDQNETEDSSDPPPSEEDDSDNLEVEDDDSDDPEVVEDGADESEVDDSATDDAAEDPGTDADDPVDDAGDSSEAVEEDTGDDTDTEETDSDEDGSNGDSTVTEETEDESATDDAEAEEAEDEAEDTPISSAADAQGNIEVTGMNVQGSDPENEWVELTNVGDTTVDMSGWTVRDRYDHGVVDGRNFRPVSFPSGFTLEPDESVRIITAPGENTDDTIHWGYNQQNWNQDGDVIIVLDSGGDTVLEHTYGNPSD